MFQLLNNPSLTIIIYHPAHPMAKVTLDVMKRNKDEVTYINTAKETLTTQMIHALANCLGMPLPDLLDQESAEELLGKNAIFSDDVNYTAIFQNHPKLLSSPIILKHNKAIIVRSNEDIDNIGLIKQRRQSTS